jgi:hypothetical protein
MATMLNNEVMFSRENEKGIHKMIPCPVDISELVLMFGRNICKNDCVSQKYSLKHITCLIELYNSL